MNFTVYQSYSQQAKHELHVIGQLEDLIEFGSTSWLTRVIDNISSTVQLAENMLFSALSDLASCIHKLVRWLWTADEHSQREATKQLWNTFVAAPVKWITLPLRIVNEPLYRKIALKVDKNSYVSNIQATFRPEAASVEVIKSDFAKEHHLVFTESAKTIEEIQRFVHTLKENRSSETKSVPSDDEYLLFYRERLKYKETTLEEIRRRYFEDQTTFITEVKQTLAKEYLQDNGIEDADRLVKRAFQFSTQETWKAIKLALKRFGVQICLEQNNLQVSADKRVYLELKFVNFAPLSGAWMARDIIHADTEHHEGCLKIELTADDPGTLNVKIGDGCTGSQPIEMHGGIFVARGRS